MKITALIATSLALVSCLGAVGCAADSTSNDEAVESGNQDLMSSLDVPNPSGAYLASVTANGTGCPAGSWDAAISPDGKAFTLTFSSYEAIVEPGQAFSIKDCNLGLDLRSPAGLQFSVSSFHYQGYALLDSEGMTATQSAKYYFQGNPSSSTDFKTELSGPYDDSYLFTDNIAIANLTWSPCGQSRRLNALTRLTAKNNRQKTGSAYLNTSTVDGEHGTPNLDGGGIRFEFGLLWRKC